MSDVQHYLLKADNDKAAAEQIAKETALNLETKKTSLLDVVQSLGEYINDEDSTIRSKAVTYLSHIVIAMPDGILSRQQVQVLCQFLCDRIEDGGAISGLKKLQTSARFNNEMAVMTFRALTEHFQDLMIRPHSQRLQILEVLNDLMLRHRAALKNLGNEAITGITDLVSGEKDPRSLMIIFSVLHVVAVEWDITGQAKSLFDSFFSYYPITFRPPPDEPFRITAQDLKSRLRNCISASSQFAPFAFPQLVEKLESTSPAVKQDVLQTLTACASSYSVAVMSHFSITLWDSLKYEILNVQEQDVAEDALIALRAIAAQLAKGLTSTHQTSPLAEYLGQITKECNQILQEPQHKQAKTAGQIFRTLATSSLVSLYLIVKAAIPPLLTLYQDTDSIADQKALLEVLVQIYDAAVALDQDPGLSPLPSDSKNPLLPFKDRLFELFGQVLMGTPREEVSFRIVALKGLLRLCQIRDHLEKNEIGLFVQYLDELVLTEDPDGREEVRNEAITALVELSRLKPSLIMDITFPAFLAKLPDESIEATTNYIITLEVLARLSVERPVSDTLVRRLLNKLENVLQSNGPASYAQGLLSTIDYVLSKRDLSSDPNLSSYYEKIAVTLVRHAALASVGSGSQMLTQALSLEILGRLAGRIIGALGEHNRRLVAREPYTLFVEEGTSFVPVLYTNGLTEKQRLTMILSTWILASVRSEARALYTMGDDDTDLEKIISELTRLAILESVPVIRSYILKQIALLVNRSSLPEGFHWTFNIMRDPLRASQLHADTTSTFDVSPVIFWVAKALLFKDLRTEEVLEHVLGLLPNTSHGSAYARGFGTLLAPDEILSKEHGAVIRLLAKQKVFSICVPRIAADFRTAESVARPNYLIALSGILRHVPREVMMMEVATLLPLLLQSLDIPDQEVKAATIVNLAMIGQESPGAVEAHIGTLINRLLQSASNVRTSTTKVRYHAVRCLQIFPGKVKESVLLPCRSDVIRGILPVLDDPKRNVRRAAVECRTVWLNMDEADAED
ncbi:MAG: hypothetical protein Q9211_000779 [Gyalolechia sp. 1 TL-2023]